jgi:hypothetical protein
VNRTNVRDDCVDPVSTQVGNDHSGALVGEQLRGGSPHPTCRPGDDRDPSGN